jgi:hypothetical protein
MKNTHKWIQYIRLFLYMICFSLGFGCYICYFLLHRSSTYKFNELVKSKFYNIWEGKNYYSLGKKQKAHPSNI